MTIYRQVIGTSFRCLHRPKPFWESLNDLYASKAVVGGQLTVLSFRRAGVAASPFVARVYLHTWEIGGNPPDCPDFI
jgi:hypothetical protein